MPKPTNTQFALAVHLLTLLSGVTDGTLLDSKQLAFSPQTNPAHVRRVLGRLRDANLVTSQMGPNGGWRLARRADEIDLAEVWRAVNGDDPLLGMHTPDLTCPVGRRVEENLHSLDRQVVNAVLQELAHQTVADVDGHGSTAAPAPAKLG